MPTPTRSARDRFRGIAAADPHPFLNAQRSNRYQLSE
jgi:hypothetical protein